MLYVRSFSMIKLKFGVRVARVAVIHKVYNILFVLVKINMLYHALIVVDPG